MPDLLRLLEPEPVSNYSADLPRQYRKRYEERVSDGMALVKRELEEYQKVIEAEHRAKSARRKTRSARGEQ